MCVCVVSLLLLWICHAFVMFCFVIRMQNYGRLNSQLMVVYTLETHNFLLAFFIFNCYYYYCLRST